MIWSKLYAKCNSFSTDYAFSRNVGTVNRLFDCGSNCFDLVKPTVYGFRRSVSPQIDTDMISVPLNLSGITMSQSIPWAGGNQS
jgi:hypothetical protein